MSSQQQRAGWPALVFLAPALLVYTVFSAWPLADTLRLGLYATDETGGTAFAGLANFRTLLFD
ncbi:MAG TPA: sugar ABC transporter permease, partial [Ideonella sp.]|nr:sugar ABC transporter permease [Ideonella sp.]